MNDLSRYALYSISNSTFCVTALEVFSPLNLMDSIKFEVGCVLFYLLAVTCLPSCYNICSGLPLYSITALSKLQHYGSIIAALAEACGILGISYIAHTIVGMIMCY